MQKSEIFSAGATFSKLYNLGRCAGFSLLGSVAPAGVLGAASTRLLFRGKKRGPFASIPAKFGRPTSKRIGKLFRGREGFGLPRENCETFRSSSQMPFLFNFRYHVSSQTGPPQNSEGDAL